MSDINRIDSIKLEKIFEMSEGYVLDFSNSTFRNFIFETLNIDIYDSNFEDKGTSKANRLRTFWKKETNYNVSKLNNALLDYWLEVKLSSFEQIDEQDKYLHQECLKISERLLQSTSINELSVIRNNSEDMTYNKLATSIRDSINRDKPEEALDRLHTYLVKFIRSLCDRHDIKYNKSESLNAVYGKYVKFINLNNHIESLMTEKILKYSIGILKAFNDVRNNKSLAHDNQILNYSEILLIFNNITNSIKFIENLESKIIRSNEALEDDDFPF